VKRRLFNIVTWTSLVLCAIAIADYPVQHWYCHTIGLLIWRTDGTTRITHEIAITARGGVVICTAIVGADNGDTAPPEGHIEYSAIKESNWPGIRNGSLLTRAGFYVDTRRHVKSEYFSGLWDVWRTVMVPTWFIVATCAVMPAIALRHWQRRRRAIRLAAAGRCISCGYDLRSSPERCPECGSEYEYNRLNPRGFEKRV
jgi:hypothetical protein